MTLDIYWYRYTDTEENQMAAEKVTFTLPEQLVRRLERIPAGKRSSVVKEALERELDRRKAVAALRRFTGKAIWKEKRHPELRSPKDFARYRAIQSRLTG